MYPTPRGSYFKNCVLDPRCKPHLAAMGRELLDGFLGPPTAATLPVRGGALFARFMLAGFAAFRALDASGIAAFECYPELEFRLWSDGGAMVPKRFAAGALKVRRAILARLARVTGIGQFEPPATLDQADAAVLALGAAAGALIEIRSPCEGGFLLSGPLEIVGPAAPVRTPS